MKRRSLMQHALGAGSAFLAAAVLPMRAFAQGYPDKPVRFVVPYPPGGGTDVIARIVQDKFRAALGQPRTFAWAVTLSPPSTGSNAMAGTPAFRA